MPTIPRRTQEHRNDHTSLQSQDMTSSSNPGGQRLDRFALDSINQLQRSQAVTAAVQQNEYSTR